MSQSVVSNFQFVETYLQKREIGYQLADTPYSLIFLVEGENGAFYCTLHMTNQDVLLCYALAPFPLDRSNMSQLLLLVAELNWGMQVGNFEIAPDTANVRFKSSVDLEGVVVSEATLRNVLESAVSTMDHYLPRFAEWQAR